MTGKKAFQIVAEALQEYANRGVFRGFHQNQKGEFSFTWFYHHPMQLTLDVEKGVMRFDRLLPSVPAKSEFYAELKQFLHERHDLSLPEHRRVNRELGSLTLANQRGSVSLTYKVRKEAYAYGVNKLINIVHELFVYLRSAHPDYLVENFNVPQE